MLFNSYNWICLAFLITTRRPLSMGISAGKNQHMVFSLFCLTHFFSNWLFYGLWTIIYEYCPPPSTYRSFAALTAYWGVYTGITAPVCLKLHEGWGVLTLEQFIENKYTPRKTFPRRFLCYFGHANFKALKIGMTIYLIV